MAVPRNRLSNARKGIRRSHDAAKPKQMANCSNCGSRKLPHFTCPSCGAYAGVPVQGKKAEVLTENSE